MSDLMKGRECDGAGGGEVGWEGALVEWDPEGVVQCFNPWPD